MHPQKGFPMPTKGYLDIKIKCKRGAHRYVDVKSWCQTFFLGTRLIFAIKKKSFRLKQKSCGKKKNALSIRQENINLASEITSLGIGLIIIFTIFLWVFRSQDPMLTKVGSFNLILNFTYHFRLNP